MRRHPGSRRHPHFQRELLERTLAARSIAYVHAPDLGGHRDPRPDSPNVAWKEPAFRAYADHMATPEFRAAAADLVDQAGSSVTTVMCAEADPSRCHRRLLSDHLVVMGIAVHHVLPTGELLPHRLDPRAMVGDQQVTYPGEGEQLGLFDR